MTPDTNASARQTAAELCTALGQRVRNARKGAGLARKQLAAKADVSERYLHQLETGGANVSIGVLLRVAQALDLDLTSLLAGKASRNHGDDSLGRTLARMSTVERDAAAGMLERFVEERRRAVRGIALLGLRGAGKTTLGRQLAERLGVPFVSITREIETRAGMGIDDLFNLGGPEAYRTVENDVARSLAERGDRIVLETAGGIAGNSEALTTILSAFKTVWLQASPQEHLARVIAQGDMRPVHGNPKALEHLQSLLAARAPDYARAECVLDTSGRSVDACLAELEELAAAPA